MRSKAARSDAATYGDRHVRVSVWREGTKARRQCRAFLSAHRRGDIETE
jgi:hypothetical protein